VSNFWGAYHGVLFLIEYQNSVIYSRRLSGVVIKLMIFKICYS